MQAKKNVLISVNPEDMEMLSPDAVKVGIQRRAASAHTLALRRRMMTGAMLIMSVVLSVTVGAFVTVTPAAATVDKTEPVVGLCYEPGVGPWDITKNERDMSYIAAASSARSEDTLTIQAVAQAIRNTCEDLEMSVEDVLKDFKYALNCLEVSNEVRAAVELVVDDGVYAVNADIHYFYKPAV